jgi:GrpB-like predicted nucleotidyltransferase (UPF0157 family)
MSAETLEQKVQRVLKDKVEIAPYDPRWPELFQQEKEHLLTALPKELIRRIEHFGSTAVHGLAAKPVVDMLVEVTDLQATRERIVPLLEAESYDYFWRPTSGDDVPPFYAWFIKRDRSGARTHHIHMMERAPEFAEHWERLLFRDYLIRYPEAAREYGELKMKLSTQYPEDRVAYTAGKSQFISNLMARVRAELK